MEATGFDDFCETLNENATALSGQIVVDVVFEAHAGTCSIWPPDRIETHNRSGIDDGYSRATEIFNCRVKDGEDLRIRCVALIGFAQNADGGAFQPVAIKRSFVVLRQVARCSCCYRVVWIGTDDDREHFCCIFDCACNWPGNIRKKIEGQNTGAAGKSHSRANADERLMR